MKPRRTGTSVASILLLTAVVAIYAAGISSIRTMDEPPPAEVVAILLIVGLLFGTICGAFLGAIGGKRNAILRSARCLERFLGRLPSCF